MGNGFTYTFIIDEGIEKMSHDQFLREPTLRARVDDPDNHRLFLGLTVVCFTPGFMDQHRDKAEMFRQLEHDQVMNPLKFYAPNSQAQMDFINDWESSISAMVDSNRVGKTSAAWIKVLVAGPKPAIICDPKWPIFTEHGIEYAPFRGVISVGLCTYNLSTVQDPLWKTMVRKWTPDWELGVYGRMYKKSNARFEPSWGHNDMVRMQKSESTLSFYTYEMDQGRYEGPSLDKVLWDEQGRESMFDGADRGTRTTRGKHYFSLTPHHVRGRPDTGATGWLYPVLTGKRKKGHSVKVYRTGDIRQVPSWIYPEEEKNKEFRKWRDEPKSENDYKAQAEGNARLFGLWHITGGLVLDEFDPDVHFIAPIWDTPPPALTLYRGIDHGMRQPTVFLCAAVDTRMNIYIYREHYSKGKQIAQDVERIVEQCGNTRNIVSQHQDEFSGMVMPLYQEVFVREGFKATAMDGRSFDMPEKFTGKTYGWLYRQAGLRNLVKASGKHYDHWVPIVNSMFLNAARAAKGEDIPGAKLWIFNTCVNLKRELMSWGYRESVREDKEDPETPRDKDDHGPTALGYMAQIPMRFMGNDYTGNAIPFRDPNNYWADPMNRPNVPERRRTALGYRPM